MKKKIISIVLVFISIILNFNMVFADDDTLQPLYGPPNINNTSSLQMQLYGFSNNKIANAGATIAGYIVYAGIVVAVVVLMLKGIKFITSSPEGKADVKKELIPWAIGIVILFSIRVILQFIVNFAQNNINNLTI